MIFSREQEIKKTYLQLGNKFNLPTDLIIYIYNIIRTNEKKIMNDIRIYHIDISCCGIKRKLTKKKRGRKSRVAGSAGATSSIHDIKKKFNPHTYEPGITEWLVFINGRELLYLIDKQKKRYRYIHNTIMKSIKIIGFRNYLHVRGDKIDFGKGGWRGMTIEEAPLRYKLL